MDTANCHESAGACVYLKRRGNGLEMKWRLWMASWERMLQGARGTQLACASSIRALIKGPHAKCALACLGPPALLCERSWVQMLEKEGKIAKFVPIDFNDAETVFDQCLKVRDAGVTCSGIPPEAGEGGICEHIRSCVCLDISLLLHLTAVH